MVTINPATEEIINEYKEDTKESLQSKLNVLHSGQKEWYAKPLQERIEILKTFAGVLTEEKEECAVILSTETGKPLQQARNEIAGAVTRIHWLTENAEKYLSTETMLTADGLKEEISYEPLGTVCNISAWNYPYLIGVNVFVPALMAGNAVMYKPSEYVPGTGLQIEKLLKKSGVPDDVFTVALGAKEVGEALTDLPFDGYFFTGSYKTGKLIYERVTLKMVPCQLELGGKDAIYITDDIQNIQSVAEAVADGAFYNNGQSCCSVERIYVHEKVYKEFLNHFINQVKAWKTGLPTEQDCYFGPLTRNEQRDVLDKQIEDAVKKGATVLSGGKRKEGKGYYYEPSVLTNVTNEMLIMREESFGPIIGIMQTQNDEQAVELMNDTDYGLTAGIYSESEERAIPLLAKLNSGTVYCNCCDRVSAAVPWSGRKHSGIGSTLSHVGLRAFTKSKAWQLKRM